MKRFWQSIVGGSNGGANSRRSRPRLEALERRELLTAGNIIDLGSSILIEGSSFADRVTVAVPTGRSVVRVTLDYHDGTAAVHKEAWFPTAGLIKVAFCGREGDDWFENSSPIGTYAEGDDGNDILIGGPQTDFLFGGRGDDQLFGNGGKDDLRGHWGNDILNGGDHDDFLCGDPGDDLLIGEGGNDRLDGADGLDSLYAGAGDDYLDGGADGQWDLLYGMDGWDTFVAEWYRPAGDFSPRKNRDMPKDWQPGEWILTP